MLSDIDSRLNMSFSVSFEVDSFVLSSIVNSDSHLPLNIHDSGDKCNIDFFVEKVSLPKEVYDIFVPVHVGQSIILSEVVNSIPLRKLHESMTSINSLVMSEIYSWEKQIFATCRFHELDKHAVADFLREFISSNQTVNLFRLGKTEGLRHSLDFIDLRTHLSVVSFSYREPKENEKYFLEWRGVSGKYNAVLYPMGRDKSPVFSSVQSGPMTNLLSSILKDRLPVASYLEEHAEGLVNCVAIVPSSLINPFSARLINFESEFTEFEVDGIYPYSEAKNII